VVCRFFSSDQASSAAEFALVLPIALLMLFGVIDVGIYAWQLNEYEKATQMGARFAVVTDLVSASLADEDLTWVGAAYCDDGSGGLRACNAGETIGAAGLGTITCTSTACSLSGNFPDSFSTSVDATAFGNIVARMQRFQPQIAASNVRVEYRGSGLGFAGDPNKPEMSPIVTVRVNDAAYQPIVLSPFGGGTVALPDFSYSLTLEDGEGAAAS
jgi:Flp pilus assembly protein TadG